MFLFKVSSWVILLIVMTVNQGQNISNQKYSWNRLPSTTTRTTTITTTTTAKPKSALKPAQRILTRDSGSVIFPKDVPNFGDPNWATDTDQFQQVPPSLLRQLSEAQDVNDFLKYVDNATVVEVDGNSYVYGSWETLDGRTLGGGGERDASIPAKPANCIPELQTVPLIENPDPLVLYYPTCTRIERCGGCCTSELLACEPTKKETIFLQVIKTKYSGGTRMVFDGKQIVQLDKHLACKCQCRTKATDCTKNQVYLPGGCKCECVNLDDRRKCESENRTRYWDSHECTCRCRDSSECSTGSYFNEDTCQCDPWPSRRNDVPVRASYGEGGRFYVNQTALGNSDGKPSIAKAKEEEKQDLEDKEGRPMEKFQFPQFNFKWKNQRTNT